MACRDCRRRARCACRSFFQQLVVAVDYCHAMGIRIHDLRPHNMLLVEHNDSPSLCRCASTWPAVPLSGRGVLLQDITGCNPLIALRAALAGSYRGLLVPASDCGNRQLAITQITLDYNCVACDKKTVTLS